MLPTRHSPVGTRPRTNSVNTVNPEEFPMGMAITPPKKSGLSHKFSGFFRPVDTWSDETSAALSEFDSMLVTFATKTGNKYLSENIQLEDESYKERPLFRDAIINKTRYIQSLISAANLEIMKGDDGLITFNKTLINMIKRYLDPIIRLCIERRNPEYLLLLAASPCTIAWLKNEELQKQITRFNGMLEDAVDAKDIDNFKAALLYGFGTATEVAVILCEGVDIVNFDSFSWTVPDMKTALEKQAIPTGVKADELLQKRYPACQTFFGDVRVRDILRNNTGTLYNRMRSMSRHLNRKEVGGWKKRKQNKTVKVFRRYT